MTGSFPLVITNFISPVRTLKTYEILQDLSPRKDYRVAWKVSEIFISCKYISPAVASNCELMEASNKNITIHCQSVLSRNLNLQRYLFLKSTKKMNGKQCRVAPSIWLRSALTQTNFWHFSNCLNGAPDFRIIIKHSTVEDINSSISAASSVYSFWTLENMILKKGKMVRYVLFRDLKTDKLYPSVFKWKIGDTKEHFNNRISFSIFSSCYSFYTSTLPPPHWREFPD